MLRLEHVSLTLGDREVLHDVSFEVLRGETKVILGASGSGKTTILRLILGLYRPDAGSIRIDGIEMTKADERDLRRCREKMAMVFQSAALFDSLTVRENVGYRLRERGTVPEEQIDHIVKESLRFVALEDVLDKMPSELSGGMRKRVAIARALASGAETILYDEPTAGLDPINTCLITRLILKLKAKHVTQVVVTHDLSTAYRIADSILMLRQGRVVFEGTVEELKRSENPDVRLFIDPGSQFAHEQDSAPLAEHPSTIT